MAYIETAARNPVVIDLSAQFLPANVDLTVTPDEAGWYYKPETRVKIVGDHRVGKATAGDKVFGIVKVGIHKRDLGDAGLTDKKKVFVMPLRFNKAVIFGVSGGSVSAGADAVIDPTNPARYTQAAAVTIAAGATPVTSGAANGSGVISGGVLPEIVCGIFWIGATVSGKEIQVII